jgi:glutamine amidotransferase
MNQLTAVGGDDLIRQRVAAGRPVLGICVGHQVLYAEGVEHGVAAVGVGLYPGTVERVPAERLPHMGWNEVTPPAGSHLFEGVERERFYFVHSYAGLDRAGQPPGAQVTWTTHEDVDLVAAVEWGALASTQFHPEKSGAAGARLLRNWVARVQAVAQ